MNGVHDMGGMHGMGPIEAEPNEPVFHKPWEGRVYALSVAHSVGGVEDAIGAVFDSILKVFQQLTISGCLTMSAGSQSVSTDYSEANSPQKLN